MEHVNGQIIVTLRIAGVVYLLEAPGASVGEKTVHAQGEHDRLPDEAEADEDG